MKTKNLTVREKVEQWLGAVEKAGSEMTVYGNISKDVSEALETQLMSVKDYIDFIGM